jgi:adenylate kinase
MSDTCDRNAWLKGPAFACQNDKPVPRRAYRMVLLGAPGVGKGTQAELLCDRLGTCQLSTGDVFRAAKCMNASELSPAMEKALGYMQRGELVPDDTVIEMVRERVMCLKCQYGFLLDGFPRTVAQAEALDQMLAPLGLKLDAVLSYELPMEQVVARLGGRRTCRACKTTFHAVSKPPQKEGVCDKCGGELYTREDDRPEAIRVRLQAYEDSTAPLVHYYAAHGTLITVPADGSPDEVFKTALKMIGNKIGLE